MSSLVNYMGLSVLSPDPSGDGGKAINDDLKSLVTWNPKTNVSSSASPSASDDSSSPKYYYPMSMWLKTHATSPQLWVCQSSAVGAAVWSPVLMSVKQDTAPQLGGNLNCSGFSVTSLTLGNTMNANSQAISSVKNIGVGIAANSTIGVYVSGTYTGGITARGLFFLPTFGTDVTNPICMNGGGTMTSGGATANNAYTYRADDWTTNGVTMTNLYGYYCANLTAATNNYAFRSLLNRNAGSGTNYNLYFDGNAPSYLSGNLLIGTTTIPSGVTCNLILGDTVDISVGTSTGTKIGAANTQKLGFWGATPTAQYATTGTTTGFTASTGTTVVSGSTFTGNTGTSAYTIGDVVAALKKSGIMAS